jgi:hypothetical protein
MQRDLVDCWKNVVSLATLPQDVDRLAQVPGLDPAVAHALALHLRGMGGARAACLGGLGQGTTARTRLLQAVQSLARWVGVPLDPERRRAAGGGAPQPEIATAGVPLRAARPAADAPDAAVPSPEMPADPGDGDHGRGALLARHAAEASDPGPAAAPLSTPRAASPDPSRGPWLLFLPGGWSGRAALRLRVALRALGGHAGAAGSSRPGGSAAVARGLFDPGSEDPGSPAAAHGGWRLRPAVPADGGGYVHLQAALPLPLARAWLRRLTIGVRWLGPAPESGA